MLISILSAPTISQLDTRYVVRLELLMLTWPTVAYETVLRAPTLAQLAQLAQK